MSDYPDKTVFFTLYENLFDNRILKTNQFEDVPWATFVQLILNEHQLVTKKEDAKLIAPVRFYHWNDAGTQHAVYTKKEAEKGYGEEKNTKLDDNGNPYTWRGAVNVEAWSMLPVDIDGEQSMEDARNFFAEYTYVGYTSFNHLKDGETEKFRLLLLLENPVIHMEFTQRLESIKEWLGKVDLSTVDASRGFYQPSCLPQREEIAKRWYNEGKRCLDIHSFEVRESIPKQKTKTVMEWSPLESDEDKKDLLDKLREVYLGNYEKWWKVSSAMVDGGFTLDDFKYVTIGGMMSKKDASDCDNQWSRALARHKRGHSISVGYLYNLVGGSKVLRFVKKERLENEIEELERLLGK